MEYVVGLLGSTPVATFYKSSSLNNHQGFSFLGLLKLTVATEDKALLKAVPGGDVRERSGQAAAVLMVLPPHPLCTV